MPDPLRVKIDDRMDKLQAIMESNEHLTNPEKAMGITHRISPFWSILSEEDREYVQCAQDAISEGWEWGEIE